MYLLYVCYPIKTFENTILKILIYWFDFIGLGVNQSSGSLWQLLKVPSVLVTGLVIVVGSNTWGFLDPTLEPHLRQV